MERLKPRRRCGFYSSHVNTYSGKHRRRNDRDVSRMRYYKRVAFSDKNTYHLIPASSAESNSSLHYTRSDYHRFKDSALEEIRELKSRTATLSTKQAVSLLYQPSYSEQAFPDDAVSSMHRTPFLFPLRESDHPLSRILRVVSVTYQTASLKQEATSLTRSVMILIPKGADIIAAMGKHLHQSIEVQ